MLPRFVTRTIGKIVGFPIRRRLAAFERATHQPEAVQAALLRDLLTRQADTGFGRDHHFRDVRTVDDFRRQVPAAPYEYVAPYIERVKRGDTRALLADERVLMFALTSGTTAARKLIPVTPRYLDDYRRGWNLWGLRAYVDHRPRRLFLRPIVQMGGDPEEYRTEAGIPCGNLSGYTAEVQKRIIRRLYAVPPETARIKDSAARYYVALRFSLARRVAMFLAANPSTLVAMARTLDREAESLVRDLRDGTLSRNLDIPDPIRAKLAGRLKKHPDKARELAAVVEKLGTLRPADVWPAETILIGTWTGGSMGPYLRQLPRYFGDAPVRDLGLLASEGRMTIPNANSTPAGVLDITSHFFEFVPEAEIDSPTPTFLGVHEVKEGASYFIVPTTAYGLYRYQISDLVRVTGFFNKTPLVEFLGKGNRFANLTGEKLSEHQVTQAMEAVVQRVRQPVSAYSLAPVWDDRQPYYGLFLEESDLADGAAVGPFLAAVDRALGEQNIEYAAKRASGRLGPVRLEVLPAGAWAKWDRDRLAKTGGSPEQYKHPCLIGDAGFRDTMPVLREMV
jgi:hypothetical protein